MTTHPNPAATPAPHPPTPQKTPSKLQHILSQFRDDARNNRDLGDRFERLIQQFLRVDPLYAALISEV